MSVKVEDELFSKVMSTCRTWLESGTVDTWVILIPVSDELMLDPVTAFVELHLTDWFPSDDDSSENVPVTPATESQLL
jgi:hypothetical protein